MRTIYSTRNISIPEGVTVDCSSRVVTVTGPRGVLSRDFKHMSCDIQAVEDGLKVDVWFGTRKVMAALRTVCSHIENMMTGVTIGFKYKMRFCYSHFTSTSPLWIRPSRSATSLASAVCAGCP